MSISDLWPLAIEAWEALGAGYGPVMARTAAQRGRLPGRRLLRLDPARPGSRPRPDLSPAVGGVVPLHRAGVE